MLPLLIALQTFIFVIYMLFVCLFVCCLCSDDGGDGGYEAVSGAVSANFPSCEAQKQ